jgi:hypothetical protein
MVKTLAEFAMIKFSTLRLQSAWPNEIRFGQCVFKSETVRENVHLWGRRTRAEIIKRTLFLAPSLIPLVARAALKMISSPRKMRLLFYTA